MFSIRPERPGDHTRIFAVHEAAFTRPNEARLVGALREAVFPQLSLVAEQPAGAEEDDGPTIVGHVFLSPVNLDPPAVGLRLGGLAPVAVAPAYQGRGIGSALVREALRRSLDVPWDAVFLVGDPGYYFRFGFVPARPRGFTYGDPVTDEVLQVRELRPRALAGYRGRVVFHPAFADCE